MVCSNECSPIAEFKTGRSPILIATDVAARGLGKLRPCVEAACAA